MKKRFFMLPGGRLKRVGNRWRGEDAEHYAWCRLDRRRVLSHLLDREFADTVATLDPHDDGFHDERPTTWTVLDPESRKFQTRIYVIEADYDLAVKVYAARNRNRHPEKVSCDCGCGADYRLDERFGTLAEVTMDVRRCRWTKIRGRDVQVEGRRLGKPGHWDYHTVDQFLARPDVTVIRHWEISRQEHEHPTPEWTSPSRYSRDEQLVAWLYDLEM